MEFKGYDYIELLEYFDLKDKIDYYDLNTENQEIEILEKHISENYCPFSDESNKKIIEPLGKYLKALIKEEKKGGYLAGVYEELLQLKDKSPTMFLQIYLTLLPHMWT